MPSSTRSRPPAGCSWWSKTTGLKAASATRRSLPVAPCRRVDLSHAAGVLRLLEAQLWLRVDAFHAAIHLHPPDAVPEAGAGEGEPCAGTRERDVEAVRHLVPRERRRHRGGCCRGG